MNAPADRDGHTRGIVAGLTTGLVSAATFNWFFIPPTPGRRLRPPPRALGASWCRLELAPATAAGDHNAVGHGRPPVAIVARYAGDRLELRVTDAGPGPDPAVAGRLFDPFAAGPGTGGTGVGLALARGLAEAHGAGLQYEVEGSGTTFVLALALEPVPAVAG